MARDRVADAFQVALQADDPVALYERAPCGYLSTDADGHIVKVNQTFLTLSGHDRDQLLGRPLRDLLTPGGQIFDLTHLQPMLHMHGEAREIALDLVRADGEVLPVLINATMDADSDHPPVVRVAVFDATERRQYERELMVAKERAEESERRARTLARTLQQTLIPPAPPSIPGLDVAAAYRPAGDGTEVGGDFYDLFPIGNGSWAVLMGDVCGKGAEAAVVTALVRHTVRALTVSTPAPADVLVGLNDVLCRFGADRFCTVVLATLHPDSARWHVTLSVAGHPAPLLVSGTGVVAVDAQGPIAGIFPGATYTDHELVLTPGQTMLAHTDGITEARGPEGYYGEERLLARVAELGPAPQPLVDGVVEDAVTFQGSFTRDDIVVVAVGVPPAA